MLDCLLVWYIFSIFISIVWNQIHAVNYWDDQLVFFLFINDVSINYGVVAWYEVAKSNQQVQFPHAVMFSVLVPIWSQCLSYRHEGLGTEAAGRCVLWPATYTPTLEEDHDPGGGNLQVGLWRILGRPAKVFSKLYISSLLSTVIKFWVQ